LASVSPAAAMNAIALDCRISYAPTAAVAYIDKCTISVGKFLTVEGWALDTSGAYATSVELIVDRQMRSKTRTTLRREDVLQAHPESAGTKCGFMFRIPIDVSALPDRIEVKVSGPSGSNIIGGRTNWISSTPGIKRRVDLPMVNSPQLAYV
jgi:hypothetical protein